MKLSIGFSPCPNDTFIFDALVNNKIDTDGIEFEVSLEDVQTLNQWALQDKLTITKLSYGVLPLVLNSYVLLDSGSALGKGVGPILISNSAAQTGKVEDMVIAIPGEHTTAHLLFSMAYPNAKNKIFISYDKIENFVAGNNGHGVIIHENRFTYESKGLKKITDLGDYWEQKTNSPVPLGGIVIKREVEFTMQKKVETLIKKSIEYAFSNYPGLDDYVIRHSQEMNEEIMRKHIDLYVNEFSITLGKVGRNAIIQLLSMSKASPNAIIENVFLPI